MPALQALPDTAPDLPARAAAARSPQAWAAVSHHARCLQEALCQAGPGNMHGQATLLDLLHAVTAGLQTARPAPEPEAAPESEASVGPAGTAPEPESSVGPARPAPEPRPAPEASVGAARISVGPASSSPAAAVPVIAVASDDDYSYDESEEEEKEEEREAEKPEEPEEAADYDREPSEEPPEGAARALPASGTALATPASGAALALASPASGAALASPASALAMPASGAALAVPASGAALGAALASLAPWRQKREASASDRGNGERAAKRRRAELHQRDLRSQGKALGPQRLDFDIPPVPGHCLGCYRKGFRARQCNKLGTRGRSRGQQLCGKCCREEGGCSEHPLKPQSGGGTARGRGRK